MERNNSLRRALAGVALFLALAAPAMAQTYGVIKNWVGADLMPTPSATAIPIASIPKDERVEQLGTAAFGIWWNVRWISKTGPMEGWVNWASVSRVDGSGSSGAAAAPPSGQPQPQSQTSTLVRSAFSAFARLVETAIVAPAPVQGLSQAPVPATAPAPSPAPAPVAAAPVALAPVAAAPAAVVAMAAPRSSSTGHAIVFGISQYKLPGVGTLPGVPQDMVSANAMAQLMGITPDRITTYQDDSVTHEAITAALKQLAKEVKEGEPVLIFYSGHGTRYADRTQPSGCTEGLLTAKGDVFTSQEMSQLLQPLAAITDGLFVFFDACFSGALSSTRDTGNAELRAKFALTPRAQGDMSNCDAVNDLRKRPAGTRATGNRYIYAGAARFDEMSLDDAEKGGLATTNFLNCMVDGKSKTVEALRACAQAGIERRLLGERQFAAHHMTITGDLSIRPVRSDLTPAFKQQLLATISEGGGSLANRPAAAKSAYVSSSLLTQGWPEVYNPQQAFTAIAGKAGSTLLPVEAPETLRIRSGRLQFKVQAPADGFLYVFQATGDGKNAYMLFPNLSDRDNRIKAGQTLDLPRASWALTAGGPEGDNQLLVVFSQTERDISQLVGEVSGPFLDLAVSPTGMQALALAVSRSSLANEAECKVEPAARRPAFCAAGYLASLKTIREVR